MVVVFYFLCFSRVYKKAGTIKEKKKPDVVVAKKGGGKFVKRPKGVTGRFKVVDPRMKKELRAEKRRQPTKKGKPQKGSGGKGKGRK